MLRRVWRGFGVWWRCWGRRGEGWDVVVLFEPRITGIPYRSTGQDWGLAGFCWWFLGVSVRDRSVV